MIGNTIAAKETTTPLIHASPQRWNKVADVARAVLVGIVLMGTHAVREAPPTGSWDVVVLGRVDACWVCQFGPSPHVTYTRVLAGSVPGVQASRQLALVGMADKLFPPGGIPIYRSKQEEICFLRKVVVPGHEAVEVYQAVDIIEATPENLAAFPNP